MFGKPGLVGKTSIGFNQTEVQMKTNTLEGIQLGHRLLSM